MKYGSMTKEQLVEELTESHQMIADLKNQVSLLKKSLEILHATEEKYQIYFSLSNDVMFSYDTNMMVVNVSPNIERILGYTPDEIIGKYFYDMGIIHPADLGEAIDDAASVLTGNVVYYTIHRFFTKDGEVKFGEVCRIPFKENGKVVEIISVARDMTDRIEREKIIQESRATAKALLDVSSDTSLLLDKEGKVIAINEPAARRFGKNAGELLGANIFAEIPADASAKIKESFIRVVSTASPVQMVARPLGRPLNIRMYPVRDNKGKVSRVAVNARKASNVR